MTVTRGMKSLRAAIALALCLAVAMPSAAAAAPVKVPSGVIMTMDGSQTIWSRRVNARRPVASTIKMLNALVVMEHGSLDETVTVPRAAARIKDGGVGLYAGQQITVRKLLELMLVLSANDAAETLAIHVGGSEAAFVQMMNAKAAALGLTRTHAVDPHGLSKRERSTASDLVILARNVMADPVLRDIVSRPRASVRRRNGRVVTYRATNKLLGSYAGMEGVKTGYTIPAGFCLVAVARRGDVELVAVVLGAKSNAGRFAEMRRLLDYGFAHYVAAPVSAPTTATPVAPPVSAPTTPSVPPTSSVAPTSTIVPLVFAN